MWSLSAENAFLQVAGFGRDVLLRAPQEGASENTNRIRRHGAPAKGLNDAPAVSHRPLQKYPVNSKDSPAEAGLRFEVSSLGPRLPLSSGRLEAQ